MMRVAVVMLVSGVVWGCGARDASQRVGSNEAPAERSSVGAAAHNPTTEQDRDGALRNAALLYRRNHAAWPQRIEDVAPYVHDIDRYESITFTPRPGGELVIRYELKQQMASDFGGTLSVFPPNARRATRPSATQASE